MKTSSMPEPKKKAKTMPTLKGVVFVMEGTLIRDSDNNMTLMPDCAELLTFLSLQNIPAALVTRNYSRKAVEDVFCNKLKALEQSAKDWGQKAPPNLSNFRRIITGTREDDDNDNDDDQDDGKMKAKRTIPPMSDLLTTSLAKECFGCDNDDCSEILVVGDSSIITNDVKLIGAKAALLLAEEKEEVTTDNDHDAQADLNIKHLTELPKRLWETFFINGRLGNTPEHDFGKFQRSPDPKPQSELCQMVVSGDLQKVQDVLETLSVDDITKPDNNENTALIWAAEIGNVEIAKLLVDTILEKSKQKETTSSSPGGGGSGGFRKLANYQNHRGYLGATALNRAARRNHTQFLEFLLREGDRFDMNLPNYYMQYPLHHCAHKKNSEALEFLLMCGANPWVLDRKGRTPLEDSTCETCNRILRAAMSVGT